VADEDLELRISADDDASKVLEDIAEQAEDLEDRDVELEVDVDDRKAVRSLDDLEGTAKDIAGQDWIVDFKADVDQAKRDAAQLEQQLRQTGEAGDTAGDKVAGVGGSQRVNAIRDLTGPLGEVSTQVGDFGDSFIAAGETIGQQMGLSEQAIGRLASVLGVGGIAFGAVLSFWQMFKKQAEDARKKAQEVQEALAAGEFTKAAQDIQDQYGGLIDQANGYGISLQQVIDFLTGTTDSLGRYSTKIAAAGDPQARVNALMEEFGDLTANQALGLQGLLGQLDEARSTYDAAGDSIQKAQRRQFELTKAVGGTTSAYLEQARVAVPEVRAEILKYVAAQEGIPPQKITKILSELDPTDVDEVEKELDRITKPRTVPITLNGVTIGVPTGPGTRTAPSSVTNVLVNMPRGSRWSSGTVREANRWARRNGGRMLRP
jgi:hypothetical protein